MVWKEHFSRMEAIVPSGFELQNLQSIRIRSWIKSAVSNAHVECRQGCLGGVAPPHPSKSMDARELVFVSPK